MKQAAVEWWRPVAESTRPDERSAQATAQPFERQGLSFWALMAFTFILLLAPQDRFPVLAPMRIAMLSAVIAIAAHVLSRMASGQRILSFTPAEGYALGLSPGP